MNNTEKSLSFAVIGAGVSGLVSSFLLSKKYSTDLFEANSYFGGHSNTFFDKDNNHYIDTGFIVFNYRNYPLFTKLLNHLKVDTQPSDMSFGFYSALRQFWYTSDIPSGLFAQRKNMINPKYLWMLLEIIRFNNVSLKELNASIHSTLTLGEFLSKKYFSNFFINHYILPMASAIWSSSYTNILDFPLVSFLRFFDNHGLLSVANQPQWRTIKNGSQSYVSKLVKGISGKCYLNSPIKKVIRNRFNVTLIFEDGSNREYDRVIFATHADQTIKLIDNPTNEERKQFSKWSYSKNYTSLHNDASILPPNRKAWASWNSTRFNENSHDENVGVSYYMNRLHNISNEIPYIVSLNSKAHINPTSVLFDTTYEHPLFNFDSIKSQQHLPSLNGINHSYFCGSYFGYGFHEDAVRSAFNIGKLFGINL